MTQVTFGAVRGVPLLDESAVYNKGTAVATRCATSRLFRPCYDSPHNFGRDVYL